MGESVKDKSENRKKVNSLKEMVNFINVFRRVQPWYVPIINWEPQNNREKRFYWLGICADIIVIAFILFRVGVNISNGFIGFLSYNIPVFSACNNCLFCYIFLGTMDYQALVALCGYVITRAIGGGAYYLEKQPLKKGSDVMYLFMFELMAALIIVVSIPGELFFESHFQYVSPCMSGVLEIITLFLMFPLLMFLWSLLEGSGEAIAILTEERPFYGKMARLFTTINCRAINSGKSNKKNRVLSANCFIMGIILFTNFIAKPVSSTPEEGYVAYSMLKGLIILMICVYNYVLFALDRENNMEVVLIENVKNAALYIEYEFERRDWLNLFLHLIKNDTVALTSIKTELLESNKLTNSDERILSLASNIEQACEKLSGVIFTKGENKTTILDFKYQVQKIITYIPKDYLVERYRLAIHDCEETLYVETNEDSLNRSIAELIVNALKHSPAKTPVNVYHRVIDDKVVFEIKNIINIDNKMECEKRIHMAKTFGEGKPLESIGNMDIKIGIIEAQARMDRIHGKETVQYNLLEDGTFVATISLPRCNITEEEYLALGD